MRVCVNFMGPLWKRRKNDDRLIFGGVWHSHRGRDDYERKKTLHPSVVVNMWVRLFLACPTLHYLAGGVSRRPQPMIQMKTARTIPAVQPPFTSPPGLKWRQASAKRSPPTPSIRKGKRRCDAICVTTSRRTISIDRRVKALVVGAAGDRGQGEGREVHLLLTLTLFSSLFFYALLLCK